MADEKRLIRITIGTEVGKGKAINREEFTVDVQGLIHHADNLGRIHTGKLLVLRDREVYEVEVGGANCVAPSAEDGRFLCQLEGAYRIGRYQFAVWTSSDEVAQLFESRVFWHMLLSAYNGGKREIRNGAQASIANFLTFAGFSSIGLQKLPDFDDGDETDSDETR